MQLNTVNSTLIQQPILTEAGAPILQQNPIPISNIIPTFNLPKDGQRTDDKHPKNKNPFAPQPAETEPKNEELPDLFKLVLAPDFHEIFKAFFDTVNGDLPYKQRLFRVSNGVRENKVFSNMYQKMPGSRAKRDSGLEQVVMYHTSRPGSRFIGKI